MPKYARPHVVGRRADVSDQVEPRDEFDEFCQSQMRRVRGVMHQAMQRIGRARAETRENAHADFQIRGAVRGYGGPSCRGSEP